MKEASPQFSLEERLGRVREQMEILEKYIGNEAYPDDQSSGDSARLEELKRQERELLRETSREFDEKLRGLSKKRGFLSRISGR